MSIKYLVIPSNLFKIITNILIIFTIVLFLTNSTVIVTSISNSTNIFINKMVPALFIYLLITELLINSGKVYSLSYGISNVLSKLFKIPKETTSCVVIGMLLGYPNSAKYIKHIYENYKIDKKLCLKLTSFTNNANTSYIISTIGIGMFKNINIGIILAISHFLSALMIGIIYSPKHSSSIIHQNKIISNSFSKIYSPFELILKSITNTAKTLVNIYAFTVLFSLIPTILLNYIAVPDTIKAIIIGIFEISNGINNIVNLNFSLNLQIVLSSFILSFSSLMIIFQIYSFIYVTKVKFKELFLFKFLQGILAMAITYIIVSYIYTPTLPAYSSYDTIIFNKCILPSTIYIFITACVSIIILWLYRKKRQD